MFQHAYNRFQRTNLIHYRFCKLIFASYLDYAYPYDELRPLSCDGVDTWGSYSLTLIGWNTLEYTVAKTIKRFLLRRIGHSSCDGELLWIPKSLLHHWKANRLWRQHQRLRLWNQHKNCRRTSCRSPSRTTSRSSGGNSYHREEKLFSQFHCTSGGSRVALFRSPASPCWRCCSEAAACIWYSNG